MAQTLKQIEREAIRRVAEDNTPRMIYQTIGGVFGICFGDDFFDRPPLDYPVCIVWPDKIEVIGKGKV